MNKTTWYQPILKKILESKSDILFIIDEFGLLQHPPIKKIIQIEYKNIYQFQSELKLRLLLRKQASSTIVIFQKSNNIPFDFLSQYEVLEIDINLVFPLLDKYALSQIDFENYQFIFQSYDEITKNRYEKLSRSETEEILNEILSDESIKIKRRISNLTALLNSLLEKSETNQYTWTDKFGDISRVIGELLFLQNSYDLDLELDDLLINLNEKFAWCVERFYEDLIYYPNHKLNSNILNLVYEDKETRNAVICFDCMGFEEWCAIKEYLQETLALEFEENYSFSMLPSETKYSSSALFASLLPKEIMALNDINSMHWKNERKLFYKFFQRRFDLDETEIYFQRCSDPKKMNINFDSLSDFFAIGVVFSFIDKFTHNKLMTKKMLINNTKEYLSESHLDIFIESLFEQGFRVYFTSDHGSIWATGNGVNVSKDLTDERAERYITTDSELIAKEYQTENSLLLQLQKMLGDDYLLVLTGNSMFGSENRSKLTHGGISIQEVIVPFIEVKKNDGIR